MEIRYFAWNGIYVNNCEINTLLYITHNNMIT